MREARQRDASDAIDWVEINRCFYIEVTSGRQHMAVRACDRELLHEGKHTFWQLTSGISRVSGICHPSYQCFNMLNASNDAQGRLWGKDQGVLTQTNISSPHLAYGVKEPSGGNPLNLGPPWWNISLPCAAVWQIDPGTQYTGIHCEWYSWFSSFTFCHTVIRYRPVFSHVNKLTSLQYWINPSLTINHKFK